MATDTLFATELYREEEQKRDTRSVAVTVFSAWVVSVEASPILLNSFIAEDRFIGIRVNVTVNLIKRYL